MKKWSSRIIKAIILLLPFTLGTIGFYLSINDGLINSMYRAMRLYFVELDCDYDQINILINIARWTAPVMSAAAIVAALSLIFIDIRTRMRIFFLGAIAIHGDSKYAGMLADRMGRRAVTGEETAVFKAEKHILIFNEDQKMFSFLDIYRRQLLDGNKTVYLCTERIVRGNYANQRLVLCNFAENCARQYWKEFPLALEPGEEVIVIIGFDSYGQEILTQAVLTNVYSTDSRIAYHVFGDSYEYRNLRRGLEAMVDVNLEKPERDSVYFHDNAWFTDASLINSADRIILTDDEEENNLLILNSLNKFYTAKKVYVKVTNPQILSGLWDNGDGAVIPFGTEEGLCAPEVIIDEATFDDAKRIHATYYKSHKCSENCIQDGKDCIRCELFLKDWCGLNTFTRYSNVAQADHIAVKIHILLGDGYREIPNAGAKARARFDSLSDEERRRLYEIEHIRWERYHFINNWTFSPERNDAEKRHNLLVPFSSLSAEEQEKDVDVWYRAFELYDMR